MCGPSHLRVYTALQLHSHFQNAIPDCTCTSRLALAIYYIKIQITINVHYTRNIYVTSKDIVIHCHLARFLYVHIHVHVHVLTLTSDIFFSLWSVCRYRVLSLAVRRGSSQVAKGGISSNWLNSSSSTAFCTPNDPSLARKDKMSHRPHCIRHIKHLLHIFCQNKRFCFVPNVAKIYADKPILVTCHSLRPLNPLTFE